MARRAKALESLSRAISRKTVEGFRTLPLGLEWLALHTDHRHQSVDPGMTQCLMHSPFRDRVLAQTFSTVFCLFAYPMGINESLFQPHRCLIPDFLC